MTSSGDGRVIGGVSLVHFAAHVVSLRCFNTVVGGEIWTLGMTLGEPRFHYSELAGLYQVVRFPIDAQSGIVVSFKMH
jgi:hypothetical protein